MPSQITVTAKTGPAQQVTAKVLTTVTKVELDLARLVIQVTSDNGIDEFDLRGVTTFTDTISSGNHTMVLS